MPNKYTLRVEVKSSLEEKLREYIIFYDYSQRKTVIRIAENNIYSRLLYDYAQNEVYKIDGSF